MKTRLTEWEGDEWGCLFGGPRLIGIEGGGFQLLLKYPTGQTEKISAV